MELDGHAPEPQTPGKLTALAQHLPPDGDRQHVAEVPLLAHHDVVQKPVLREADGVHVVGADIVQRLRPGQARHAKLPALRQGVGQKERALLVPHAVFRQGLPHKLHGGCHILKQAGLPKGRQLQGELLALPALLGQHRGAAVAQINQNHLFVFLPSADIGVALVHRDDH